MSKNFILFLLSLLSLSCFSQDEGFQFVKPRKNKVKIDFINYSNLIIIQAKLNGIDMNFLLDTGVDKTILFGIEGEEEKIKQNSKRILIKGVSGKKKAYAYKNKNNTIEVGNLKDTKHNIYVIFDQAFNISDKIGYQVQGILGYDFFKNHLIKIDYIKNRLIVYNPQKLNNKRLKRLKRYDSLDISLIENKPYVRTEVKQENQFESYIFLLDIGSGDAIWLKPQPNEQPPEKSFADILGYGFADIIFGIRSKAKAFKLGEVILDNPKIAYPDSLSYEGLKFTPKSGVIGSEVMRRFHWYFDYKNRKVFFKPNTDINDVFNYDMSGLVLKYDGFQAITQYRSVFPEIKVRTDNRSGYSKTETRRNVSYIEMRPVLKVGAVRPNSSAFHAGFIEGDEIISINNKNSYRYDLEEITKLFCSKEGLEIDFVIKRNGIEYDKSLILKSRFLE